MQRFGHLATRLFNVPLAIHPRKAEIVMAALADRLRIAHVPLADEDSDFNFERPADRPGARDAGYDTVGSIAIIPIIGTTVMKLGSLRPWSGMTGYDGIRLAFNRALEDPAVKAIMFDVDSPGGEVSGLFDLADEIYQARGVKPMWSILSENAFSAGYALASAADRLVVPRTGGTGSIGVMTMHVDWSRALDENGLKVTYIHHGAKKVDGAPEFPLSDRARASQQADIDAIGELFMKTVARHRGLPVAKIKAMEAGTFLGAKGVEAGLADACMAPREASQLMCKGVIESGRPGSSARRH